MLDELDRRPLPADLLSALERIKLAIYETVDEEVAGSAVVADDDLRGIVAVALVRYHVRLHSRRLRRIKKLTTVPFLKFPMGLKNS